LDNAVDAYRKEAFVGPSVFNLEERINSAYGADIWYLALKQPLSAEKEKAMKEWVVELLKGSNEYCTALAEAELPVPIEKFLTANTSVKSFSDREKFGAQNLFL
jgi:hypothetical protein